MSEDLKPCPFCGGEAVLALGGEHFTIPECSQCGAKLPAQFGEYRDALAIAAWNSRCTPASEWLRWECPDCHAVFELGNGRSLNYCPNCGVKL